MSGHKLVIFYILIVFFDTQSEQWIITNDTLWSLDNLRYYVANAGTTILQVNAMRVSCHI